VLKNEISIQYRVASAAFSSVTHVVATPRDAFNIHGANIANRTLGGENSRSRDYRGPFFHAKTHTALLPFDFGHLSRISVNNRFVLFDFLL